MKIEEGDRGSIATENNEKETFVVSKVSNGQVTLQTYDMNDLFSFTVPYDRFELTLS
jgi:hypothetical protein